MEDGGRLPGVPVALCGATSHPRQSNAGPPGLGRGEFLALAARVIAPVSALNIALVVALLTAPFTAPSSRW